MFSLIESLDRSGPLAKVKLMESKKKDVCEKHGTLRVKRKNGRGWFCLTCKSEAGKVWRSNNADKVRSYRVKSYAKDRAEKAALIERVAQLESLVVELGGVA